MPNDKDDELLRVAQDITDETNVDWDRVTDTSPELGSTLDGLRLIESLAGAYRRAREEDEDLGTTTPRALQEQMLFEWGKLRVLEKLGEGGFGEVYRAWEPTLQREVALKLRLDATGEQPLLGRPGRWLDEGRRLARVRHPNVVVVHGADVHEDRAGIWTDLLLGKTLEQWVTEQGRLGSSEAASIGIDLCLALAAVHGADLVHGDVKTSNVMREDGGRIVLMDFGSGHELSGEANTNLPPSVTPLATAPEVLRGEALSVSSDIYSLGALLYRLVTGRYPIEAKTLDELWRQHRERKATPLRDLRPDLPPAFVTAVERALGTSPGERYQSAGEMERALAAALSQMEPSQAPNSSPTPRSSGGARRMWLIAASVVLLLGALAVWRLGDTGVGPDTNLASALVVESTFYRTDGGTHEALADGARIRPGNLLSMEVESGEPIHLYVLNEDDAGNVFVLFPLPGQDPANPLNAGMRHRIPARRAASVVDWVVTSAGGIERFLTVASREPLAEFEQQLQRLEKAGADRPVVAAQLTMNSVDELLRGVGGVRERAVEPGRAEGLVLETLARGLRERTEDSTGLWVRRTELLNPGN